eukprot:scaffold2664_cov319-Prasinococcus_capsulatus_cf.AAC.6
MSAVSRWVVPGMSLLDKKASYRRWEACLVALVHVVEDHVKWTVCIQRAAADANALTIPDANAHDGLAESKRRIDARVVAGALHDAATGERH